MHVHLFVFLHAHKRVRARVCVHLPDANKHGDEHGADRISDHQVVFLHQEGRDDDTDAS